MFLAVGGLRLFTFRRRWTDRAERQIAAAHRTTQTIVFVAVNINRAGNVGGELSDQSVQLCINALDLDHIVSLRKPQMRFTFLPRHDFSHSLLNKIFFKPPVFAVFLSDQDPCFCTGIVSDYCFRTVDRSERFCWITVQISAVAEVCMAVVCPIVSTLYLGFVLIYG